MRRLCGVVVLLLVSVMACGEAPSRDVIGDVRAAIAEEDFARGEHIISTYGDARGTTPEMLEALSWLGRGALAAGELEKAETYAKQTHELARAALEGRGIDDERHLPIALGAAIEVQAHVTAERGARSEALRYLQRQLEAYGDSSIHTRIRKNINLLSLEGRQAPEFDVSEYLGPTPPTFDELKGKVVLLFFWAHWCSDCKAQGPTLADIRAKYGSDVVLLAPTQRYGFAARGEPATPDEELRYIDQVRLTSYGALADTPAPVSEANMRRYGVSTTPTLVLLDRTGVVRLYHPGRMPADEIEPIVRRLVADRPPQT